MSVDLFQSFILLFLVITQGLTAILTVRVLKRLHAPPPAETVDDEFKKDVDAIAARASTATSYKECYEIYADLKRLQEVLQRQLAPNPAQINYVLLKKAEVSEHGVKIFCEALRR